MRRESGAIARDGTGVGRGAIDRADGGGRMNDGDSGRGFG